MSDTLAYHKAYHQTHLKEAKAYRQEHREKIRAYQKDYYQAHREERLAARKTYSQVHKEEEQALSLARREKTRLETLRHYSITNPPSCASCKITDADVLCIDHINNGGTEHRKKVGGGSAFYAWLRTNNFPTDYQVLCCNCNYKKELQRRRNNEKL